MSINVFTVHTGDLAVIFSSLSKELTEVAHGVRSYETYILKLIIFSAQNYTKNTLKRPSSEVVCIWKLQYLAVFVSVCFITNCL